MKSLPWLRRRGLPIDAFLHAPRPSRYGELFQVGDVPLQRGAVKCNVRGPGQNLETGPQPAFRLLPIARLNAGKLSVPSGGVNHTLKRCLEFGMIEPPGIPIDWDKS